MAIARARAHAASLGRSRRNVVIVSVPPDILDYPTSTDMVVREGSNVTLRCAATGTPEPTVTWRREAGGTISLSNWQGTYLRIATTIVTTAIITTLGAASLSADRRVFHRAVNATLQIESCFSHPDLRAAFQPPRRCFACIERNPLLVERLRHGAFSRARSKTE